MDEIVLDYPVADARRVVQAAFESTREIQSYHDDGQRVVGKTGTSLFSTSWGEVVTARYEGDGDATTVELDAEPILGTNLLATPETYRNRVAEELDTVLATDDPAAYAWGVTRSKRVPRAELQAGIIVGGKNYSITRAVVMIIVPLVLFVLLAAML
mgnify:CR=1 FL=1